MCGFAAVVGAERVDSATGWAMLDQIRHRGPDDAGVGTFAPGEATISRAPGDGPSAGRVMLAHARLSIIDLSAAGFQPMSDEAGRVWTVFNGEIFNFATLRRNLEAHGHRFASQTDTEVLVHGYEEWGRGLLERIEGMFALCIHDTRSGTTLFARDRFGIKPLYYAHRPDGALAAASEVKALLAAGVEARLDPAGVDSFLNWLWVPDPDTAFASVKKLPPAHFLEIDADGREQVGAYWDYGYEDPIESRDQQVAALREALEEAVARQLMSDVPLGAFFSGGLDSTAIVEMMRRRLRPERPTCFTVGYSKRDLAHDVVPDDLKFARMYAREKDIDYREATLSPDLAGALPEVVWHMDEPVADPAALSAFQICRAAKEDDFTVLLSGMGGDEIFGGYPRYLAAELARRYRRLPAPVRAMARSAADALPGAGSGRLARLGRNSQKLLRRAELPFPGDYLSFLTYFDEAQRGELYTSEFTAATSNSRPGATHAAHLARVAGEPWLHQAMYVDLKTFLPSLNLTYMDKMSMAHSIEVRVPLIDELVADAMRRVPATAKMEGRRRKALFKDAMRGVVPDAIIDRQKAGFGAPVRGWLAHELKPMVEDLLAPDAVRRRGMFEPAAVERLLADFRTGRRDNALQIWQLLTLELWQQTFIDGTPARRPAAMIAAA